MSSGLVETSVSFVPEGTAGGSRWAGHKIGLTFEQVASKLEGAALERYEGLSLLQQVFLVRAVEEIALCKFRDTRHDPGYRKDEISAWRDVVLRLVGSEGVDRLGIG